MNLKFGAEKNQKMTARKQIIRILISVLNSFIKFRLTEKIKIRNKGERATKRDKNLKPVERLENQIGSHSLMGLGTQSRHCANEVITDFIS
jgi:hypothetical protein